MVRAAQGSPRRGWGGSGHLWRGLEWGGIAPYSRNLGLPSLVFLSSNLHHGLDPVGPSVPVRICPGRPDFALKPSIPGRGLQQPEPQFPCQSIVIRTGQPRARTQWAHLLAAPAMAKAQTLVLEDIHVLQPKQQSSLKGRQVLEQHTVPVSPAQWGDDGPGEQSR